MGRVPLPDRVGPSPDQKEKFVLADPGPLGDGEFDITIGGDLYCKRGLLFGINRSVIHNTESVTVNGEYVELRNAGDRLVFEHREREYSLRVLWPNGVRINTARSS